MKCRNIQKMREVDKIIAGSRGHMEVFDLEFGKGTGTSFIT